MHGSGRQILLPAKSQSGGYTSFANGGRRGGIHHLIPEGRNTCCVKLHCHSTNTVLFVCSFVKQKIKTLTYKIVVKNSFYLQSL